MSAPKPVALILAAGASSRMRGADKLAEEIDGEALLRRTARTALASDAAETLVVLGAWAERRAALLSGLPLRCLVNQNWAAGMGGSIAAGIAALPKGAAGVMILLADMPEITPDLLNRMIAGFAGEEQRIVVPQTSDGLRGNPVIFGSDHFPALGALTGERGAKSIIETNSTAILPVHAQKTAIRTDLDTPEEWAAWRAARRA